MSQFNLGCMYIRAQGVPQNMTIAARWLLKAAEGGYPMAQYGIARMYWTGNGVAKDLVEAFAWSTLALDGLDHERQTDDADGSGSAGTQVHLGRPKVYQDAKQIHELCYRGMSSEQLEQGRRRVQVLREGMSSPSKGPKTHDNEFSTKVN